MEISGAVRDTFLKVATLVAVESSQFLCHVTDLVRELLTEHDVYDATMAYHHQQPDIREAVQFFKAYDIQHIPSVSAEGTALVVLIASLESGHAYGGDLLDIMIAELIYRSRDCLRARPDNLAFIRGAAVPTTPAPPAALK
jgi:hypothetical protein